MLACHARGRGFESRPDRMKGYLIIGAPLFLWVCRASLSLLLGQDIPQFLQFKIQNIFAISWILSVWNSTMNNSDFLCVFVMFLILICEFFAVVGD